MGDSEPSHIPYNMAKETQLLVYYLYRFSKRCIVKLTPFEHNKAKGEGIEEKRAVNFGYLGYSFRMTKWMTNSVFNLWYRILFQKLN